MNGRNIFKKMKYIILVFQIFTKFIPKFILNLIWNILQNSESKGALFFRYLYLKKYSKKCGDNIFIGSNVTLKSISSLSLGNNISIHSGTYIDATGKINMSDNISIANQSSIISFEHTWKNKNIPIKYNKVMLDEISIHKDVWIGAGCRILSGVTLNSRSIVAAGAVVIDDVQSNTIVGGIPAKKIKKI